jgi:hypothetical protein
MAGHKTGIVFNENEYAGFITRLLIMAIGIAVILLLFIVAYFIYSYLYNN